jgi:hypothetical protein
MLYRRQQLDRMRDVSTCPTCRIIKTVSFWGPYKVAAWKRPALLFMSFLVIGGTLALGAFTVAHTSATWQWFLLVPLLGLGVLGVVTALRGCLDCVSRVFGGI